MCKEAWIHSCSPSWRHWIHASASSLLSPMCYAITQSTLVCFCVCTERVCETSLRCSKVRVQCPHKAVHFLLFFFYFLFSPAILIHGVSTCSFNLCCSYTRLNCMMTSTGRVVTIRITQKLFSCLRRWLSIFLSAVSLETNSPYSIWVCSIQFPFGDWLTQTFPIHHNHHIIYLAVIKTQIMEKENKQTAVPTLLVRTLQSTWAGVLLLDTEGRKKEVLKYVTLICGAAVGDFYLRVDSFCPNGFTHLRPVIYL